MRSQPIDHAPLINGTSTRIAPLRDAVMAFVCVGIGLGLLLWLVSSLMQKRLQEQVTSDLLRTAYAGAVFLVPNLSADAPRDEASLDRQHAKLVQLLRMHVEIVDAFVISDSNGTLVVTNDVLQPSNPGEIPVPDEARMAMFEGQLVLSSPHVRDGIARVSAFAPIRAKDDSILGVVGIDVPEDWFLAQQAGSTSSWIVAFGLFVMSCVAGVVVYGLRMSIRESMTAHDTRLSALEMSVARGNAAEHRTSTVMATMSHELRTPLTAILGFTDLLLDPGYDVSVVRSHAQTIRRNGQHLLNVLNDVLDISKIEAGTMHTEKVPFDPLQVANDVSDLLEPRAREKQIELSFWAGADEGETAIPPRVDGDAFRVRQILLNLVGNAIKFTEEGSVTLSVRYDYERRELSFEVADTGVGIAADQLQNLFEPYHQADASASHRSQGAGLGLAISKRLAQHLGGDIRVHSEVARGSTFTLRMPAQTSTEDELAAGMGEREGFEAWTPRPSWRILLVEDTLEHQKLFYACLRRAGHSVDVCDNGERAVHKVRESEYLREPYTIVLLDVWLPGQDGLVTAREMREHGYRGPILAITADTSVETREQCVAGGCDEIYAKPLERATLLRALTRLVRGASLGAA